MVENILLLLLYFRTFNTAVSSTISTPGLETSTSQTPTSETATTTSSTSTTAATTTTTTTLSTATTTTAATTKSPTTTTASTVTGTNLSCYDCSESFKYQWEPYTECQYYPTRSPLRPCLGIERYCKVERVTYKSMTVSITRGCTKECWHGCYASGFGLTKLKCTSCCLTPGCNTGDTGSALFANRFTVWLVVLLSGIFEKDLLIHELGVGL